MSSKIVKNKKAAASPSTQEGEQKTVALADIDFSPFNYRKFFSEKALQEFAAEITQHGIISPLTLRRMPGDRYELVAGERRLRAARMAGLTGVPAIVKSLSDEEVIEFQLAENLQREDPHPMHEAEGIGQMQKAGKEIGEIAVRLGKSKAYVYNRLKLLNLIPAFQEIFLAGKLRLADSLEIAGISAGSQSELFDKECSGWQNEESFELDSLAYLLSKYKYDLTEAPFDPKDKQLLPEMGACTHCPSNTATLKTLFPEYSKKAVCTNRECYHRKCDAHLTILFSKVLQEQRPDALLYRGSDSSVMEDIVRLVPGAGDLPKYNSYGVSILTPAEKPEKEAYTNQCNAEEDTDFDKEGFDQAMEEYKEELETYNKALQSGKVLKGLLVSEGELQILLFTPGQSIPSTEDPARHKVTAKEVQAAIKAGEATPELLQAEIDRINAREERSKEIDRDKVQEAVYNAFQLGKEPFGGSLTEADKAAGRLIIFQTLGYSERREVIKWLTEASKPNDRTQNEDLYTLLRDLTDDRYAYLIRQALASKTDGKYPKTDTGYFLYQLAGAAGLDVAAIELEQANKTNIRQTRLKERIKDLERKMSKINQMD